MPFEEGAMTTQKGNEVETTGYSWVCSSKFGQVMQHPNEAGALLQDLEPLCSNVVELIMKDPQQSPLVPPFFSPCQKAEQWGHQYQLVDMHIGTAVNQQGLPPHKDNCDMTLVINLNAGQQGLLEVHIPEQYCPPGQTFVLLPCFLLGVMDCTACSLSSMIPSPAWLIP
jgi:hypothetical protein